MIIVTVVLNDESAEAFDLAVGRDDLPNLAWVLEESPTVKQFVVADGDGPAQPGKFGMREHPKWALTYSEV